MVEARVYGVGKGARVLDGCEDGATHLCRMSYRPRAGRAAARAIRGNRAAWDTYIRRRAAPADGPGGIPVTDAVPGNQAADDAS